MIGESFYGSCENDLKQTFFQTKSKKLGSSHWASRRLIGFNLGVVQTARKNVGVDSQMRAEAPNLRGALF